MTGHKSEGDWALRPAIEKPGVERAHGQALGHDTCAQRLARPAIRSVRRSAADNRQYIFERCVDGERVLVAVNADASPYHAHFDAKCGRAVDLITGETHDFGGGSELPPYSASYWLCER